MVVVFYGMLLRVNNSFTENIHHALIIISTKVLSVFTAIECKHVQVYWVIILHKYILLCSCIIAIHLLLNSLFSDTPGRI